MPQNPDTFEHIKSILEKGKEKHLLDKDQYLESLRDGRRVIDSHGNEIEDVTTHLNTKDSAHTFSRVMDLQFSPEHEEAMTYTEADGSKRARGWQVPRTAEDLRLKREQIGATNDVTLGMFGRPPEYGPGMALGFLAIIDRVEAENPEFAQNIRDFVEESSKHNILSTDLIADAQSDRRVPRADRPATLKVVSETDDSVVLTGSKIAGSSAANSHFMTLSTTLGGGLPPEAAIWGAIPVNIDGVTLLMREPNIKVQQNGTDNPVGIVGEEMDQIILFDNVKLPKKYVFSLRNEELLTAYFDSCVFVFWHIMTRLAYRAEMFAGLAQVMVEALGTDSIPGVRRTVADITTYAQVLKSFSLAAISEAEVWNGVAVPNPAITSAGRYFSISEYDNMISKVKDLAGQGLISRWTKDIWDSEEFGPILSKYLPGHDLTAEAKNHIFNFAFELTTSANAGRLGLFEKVNATPPAFVAEIVYDHVDRSKSTEFIRNYLRHAKGW